MLRRMGWMTDTGTHEMKCCRRRVFFACSRAARAVRLRRSHIEPLDELVRAGREELDLVALAFLAVPNDGTLSPLPPATLEVRRLGSAAQGQPSLRRAVRLRQERLVEVAIASLSSVATSTPESSESSVSSVLLSAYVGRKGKGLPRSRRARANDESPDARSGNQAFIPPPTFLLSTHLKLLLVDVVRRRLACEEAPRALVVLAAHGVLGDGAGSRNGAGADLSSVLTDLQLGRHDVAGKALLGAALHPAHGDVPVIHAMPLRTLPAWS
eukprot:scaffold7375_cov268-Pinguiococcus_pyrenoidosus.AAC.41